MWSLRVPPSLRWKFWLAWSCASLVQVTTTSMCSLVQWSCHVDSILLHSSLSHDSYILLASSPTVFPEPWQGPDTDAPLGLNIRPLTPCALTVLSMLNPCPLQKQASLIKVLKSIAPYLTWPSLSQCQFVATPTFPAHWWCFLNCRALNRHLSLDISLPILLAWDPWISPMVHGKG